MNKNPFVPAPSFTPQQPPLPPGPPPPQPSQPDYNYWAAQGSQAHVQAPAVGYNPQWSAPQPPPRPPPEHSALYANYGYGTQWQRQQQQQQQHQQQYHPPPVQQPIPPPTQPGYNPYQPSAGYPQQYVPQAVPPPQPMTQPYMHPPPPQPQQPFFPSHIPHQPQPPQQQRHVQHASPQHLPPAKRQRFEGPGSSNRHSHNQHPSASSSSSQQNSGSFNAPGHGSNRGGAPLGPHGPGGGSGGGRPGQPGGRSGGTGGGTRLSRGGSMGGNRGGSGPRGRGGFGGGGAGRPGGQSGSLRGHNSQRNFGGKDFHNRRGGSFSSGGGNYQNNFRNRNQHANRSARQDSTAANAKDGAASSFGSIGKENRRTLTDFKIVGLKIPEIDWIWGIQPDIGLEMKEPTKLVSTATVKKEVTEDQKSLGATSEIASLGEDTKHSTGVSISANTVDAETATDKKASASSTLVPCLSTSLPDSNQNSPPPSRMRIYFHTPVTADDSRPIPHSSSFYGETSVSSDSRKGKRKKLEDDDGDIEEGRVAPPPPPQMGNGFGNSVINANDDRSSVAGSVAPSVPETGSEDWLMAAIVEGEEEAEAEVELRLHDEENEDEEQMNLHADLFVSKSTDEGAIADDGKFDGQSHYSQSGYDSVLGTQSVADGIATQENQPSSSPIRPSSHLEETSCGQKDVASGITGGEASSTSTSALLSAAIATEGTQEESSASSITLSVSTPVPLDGSASSSNAPAPMSATESASVFEVVSSYERSAHAQVCSVSLEPSATSLTDPTENLNNDQQAPRSPHNKETIERKAQKSLEAVSVESTLLDVASETRQDTLLNISTQIVDRSQDQAAIGEETQVDHDNVEHEDPDYEGHDNGHATETVHPEHLPEPPASPVSNTLLSTPSNSTYEDSGVNGTKESKPRVPSANRISISYAGGNRRLVIDAEVVRSMKVLRQVGMIEVVMDMIKFNETDLKGILFEVLSDTTKSYTPLPAILDSSSSDMTLPPFWKVVMPTTVTLLLYLDTQRPLSEPKWAKTGDVQEWLRSMFGRMFWVAGEAAEGWEKKIHVTDPDPPPTIWTVLDGWAANSTAGIAVERQKFLKTHMTEVDNILEILLRLVRGERATPFSQSAPTLSGPSIVGPLLSALTPGSAHASQQTHVSLAVLALFRMTVEYAQKAVGDEKGKAEAEERAGEIIRCLPSHLIYKSLDGIFKEWRVDKKR